MTAPTPLMIPRRPEWRYTPVNMAGRRVVPSAVTEEDRAIINARTHYRDQKENNENEHDRPR